MRSTPHAQLTDRRSLPRLLVGRPAYIQKMQDTIADVPHVRFDEGDILTFVCAEGWHHTLTILRLRPYGEVDAMAYDGMPHHVPTTVKALRELRIINCKQMDAETLADYRRRLDLEPDLPN